MTQQDTDVTQVVITDRYVNYQVHTDGLTGEDSCIYGLSNPVSTHETVRIDLKWSLRINSDTISETTRKKLFDEEFAEALLSTAGKFTKKLGRQFASVSYQTVHMDSGEIQMNGGELTFSYRYSVLRIVKKSTLHKKDRDRVKGFISEDFAPTISELTTDFRVRT